MSVRIIQPDERKYIFSEGIDYGTTGKRSIWGGGNKKTIQLLNRIKPRGRWLHLACGDGPYNVTLLRNVDELIAADIDSSALEKLRRFTPAKYRRKLKVRVFDITKKFPFGRQHFDGIFCTGTLHLFPKKVFLSIIKEMDRVLRAGGTSVIDFAADTKRKRFDKKPYIIHGETILPMKEAENFLRGAFNGYDLRMLKGSIPWEAYPKANPPYWYSSNYILLKAIKR